MNWAKMGRSKAERGMGFRDLTCFNTALIVKQCWRLIQNPDSLATKIIRAKYYPRGSFWDSKLGSRPSFKMVHDGVIWWIGDGRSEKIWGDCWVPRLTSFKIQMLYWNGEEDAKVCTLMDPRMEGWNVQFIREHLKRKKLKSYVIFLWADITKRIR